MNTRPQNGSQPNHRRQILILLFLFTSLFNPTEAAVIYNSFGPSDTYGSDRAQITDIWLEPYRAYYESIAARFYTQQGQSTKIESIEFAVSGSNGTPIGISIRSDFSGNPGQVIYSSNFPLTGTSAPIRTVTFTNAVLLAGTTYWISFEPSLSSGTSYIALSNTLNEGYSRTSNSTFGTSFWIAPGSGSLTWTPVTGATPAFRLTGSILTVPETNATLYLVGFAIFVTLIYQDAGSIARRRSI